MSESIAGNHFYIANRWANMLEIWVNGGCGQHGKGWLLAIKYLNIWWHQKVL